MSLSRRGFLGLAGVTGAAAGLGAFAACGVDLTRGQTAELLTSRVKLPKPYQVPLPIPPVKRPTRTDGTTDYYDIVQRVAEVEILPGLQTPIFGYDGIFPGPTLATRSGRRAVVRHRNQLPVPTVVHLHGGHTPPEHDGYPIDLLLPLSGWKAPGSAHGAQMVGRNANGVRDYVYPGKQRAATLWYHDHRMDFTAPQVYRGLAGFHLVHDDEEDALPLPKGERDIPLMICDRAFEADGSFRYPALDRELRSTPGVQDAYMEGVLGDVVLVNGAPWPVLEVDAARYRFRILNASNARRYQLELRPGRAPFVQVGSDGGLLEAPVSHGNLTIAPAERFDVVVDFSVYPVGTEITLVNGLGNESTGHVMKFRVARKASDDSRVPARLSTIEKLDPAKAVRTRDWTFRRVSTAQQPDGGHAKLHWAINGKGFDPRRMDAEPRLGDIEIWRFKTDLFHPVHVHLDPFQVLGGGDTNAGWKDTVDLRPSQVVEVAVRFTDYAGAYMMHCHNLEHEDMAMMTAFRTVA
jgi:spore coat protein A, manganese oxidase